MTDQRFDHEQVTAHIRPDKCELCLLIYADDQEER